MKRTIAIFTSFFAPASQPDRFANALASGTDLIYCDLDDPVPADGTSGASAAVWINELRTADGLAEQPGGGAMVFGGRSVSRVGCRLGKGAV